MMSKIRRIEMEFKERKSKNSCQCGGVLFAISFDRNGLYQNLMCNKCKKETRISIPENKGNIQLSLCKRKTNKNF